MDNEPSHSEVIPARPGRFLPQVVFGFVALITLVVLIYEIENWRGRRAWEKYKAVLTARGEQLDWNAYIPKQIPDDQNMLKVPVMAAWFPRDSTNSAELARISEIFRIPAGFESTNTPRPTLLELKLSTFETPDKALSLEEFAQGETMIALAYRGVTILPDPRGSRIFGPVKAPAQRVTLRLKAMDQKAALEKALAKESLQLAASEDAEIFRVTPSSGIPAQAIIDYLKQHESILAEIETASRRTGARLDGDFLEPFLIQVPSFVRVRSLVQALGARADAEILLNQPEAAARDVATILRIVDLLNGSQPSLLCKMIGVAVIGLAEDVVQNGFREGVWQESQLVDLEQQFRPLNLLNDVSVGLRGGERAGVNFMLENYSRGKLLAMFEEDEGSRKAKWRRPEWLYFRLAPRGWIYQNELIISRVLQEGLDSMDLARKVVNPAALKTAMDNFLVELGGNASPYNHIAAKVVPNYFKAIQTACKNQTFVDELRVACALERYRKAHGQYPDRADALVPHFIEAIPQDVISGKPLKYLPKGGNGYLLYGVGWDGKDDGGVMGNDSAPDWLWRAVPTEHLKAIGDANVPNRASMSVK
jgi:hypothetical protein